jgi:hypothetical protein
MTMPIFVDLGPNSRIRRRHKNENTEWDSEVSPGMLTWEVTNLNIAGVAIVAEKQIDLFHAN